MQADFWIRRPFNSLFISVFAVCILLLAGASIGLWKKDEKTKELVLIIACVITLIGFVLYKIALSRDAEYNIIRADLRFLSSASTCCFAGPVWTQMPTISFPLTQREMRCWKSFTDGSHSPFSI